jgi:hypothetical protein
MNKQEVYALIDRLADKTLSFGCNIKRDGSSGSEIICGMWCNELSILPSPKNGVSYMPFTIPKPPYSQEYQILGHPVRIGDVLAKDMHQSRRDELVRKWVPLGCDKSLQQIVEESGFYAECPKCEYPESSQNSCNCKQGYGQLRVKEARALFDYLAELFPVTK